MIRKQDILDRAAEWRLRPDVVEKDYVLGWLLVALAQSDVRATWVFKGGTCIKKCFFETYRFSEDLDFSLTPEAPYTEAAMREMLQNLARLAAELSGVEFPADRVDVRVQRNRQGQPTFQGRIAYRGPLACRHSRVCCSTSRSTKPSSTRRWSARSSTRTPTRSPTASPW